MSASFAPRESEIPHAKSSSPVASHEIRGPISAFGSPSRACERPGNRRAPRPHRPRGASAGASRRRAPRLGHLQSAGTPRHRAGRSRRRRSRGRRPARGRAWPVGLDARGPRRPPVRRTLGSHADRTDRDQSDVERDQVRQRQADRRRARRSRPPARITITDGGIGIAPGKLRRSSIRSNAPCRRAVTAGSASGSTSPAKSWCAWAGRSTSHSTIGSGTRFVVELPLRGPRVSDPLIMSSTTMRSSRCDGADLRGPWLPHDRRERRRRGVRPARANGRPALILLDLRMPRMNGFEFRAVRRRTESEIPILALTGDAGCVPRRDRYRRGRLLQKPIDPGSLIDAIRAQLDPRRAPEVRSSAWACRP